MEKDIYPKYTFIYMDSTGRFNTASSLPFVAKHKACRAILTIDLESKYYALVSDFIYALNNRENQALRIANQTDLIELL